MEYKKCCNRYILPFIRIFFLITTLYFGWTYYMTYHSQINKNEVTKIIPERYSLMTKSLPDTQESHLTTEMPETFFKPEVIDKTNKVSEDMKDQDLIHKITVANVPSMMQTNIQNTSNVRSENIIRTNANGNRSLVILSSGNLEHDEKFTESSMPKNIFSIKSIDKNVSTDKNDKSDHPTQFLEKLRHISKIKATNDLEKIKNKNNFSEDVDRLMLKSQDHALGASNKSESLEFNATNSNFKNFDNHTNNANQTINTSVIEDLLDKLSDIAGGGAEIIEPFMGASQASNENNDQFNQISWKEIEKEAEEAKAEEERAKAELEAEEETIKEAENIAKAVEEVGAIQDLVPHYEHYDVHGNKVKDGNEVKDENSITFEGYKSPKEIEYKPEIIRLPEFHMPRFRGK